MATLNHNQRETPKPLTKILQLVSIASAMSATAILLFLPTGMVESMTSNGQYTLQTTTLLQSQGISILIPLLIPNLLTLFPFFTPERMQRSISISSAILLTIFTVIASATVGWFYLLAAILSILSIFTLQPQAK